MTNENLVAILLAWLKANPSITILSAITLIQITPIKINPWSWIAKTVRKALIGNLEAKIDNLSADVLAEKVASKRWLVLDFANSCRQDRKHTHEEWKHCLDELAWYETYCQTHKINNGVMTECDKYLRTEYQKHLQKNDFL